MCSEFTPGCRYNNSTIILIGDVFCPKKNKSKLSMHKKTFNLSTEAIIKARNSRLCVRCAITLLKIKEILFSCRLVKGFTFLKRLQNQFKMLLAMCIVLASIVPTEKNPNILTAMSQLQDPFMVAKNVEPSCLFTKFFLRYKITWRRQKQTNMLFLCWKKMNLVPNKQLLPLCPISINQI